MGERQRMGKSSTERTQGSSGSDYSSRASGWFVRGVGFAAIVMSLSLAVIAVCFVWFLLVELPNLIELGWSAVESADALTRAIEGMDL